VPLFFPPRETSTSGVETSFTTKVEDLENEIPTYVEDEECYEDIQDVYDQLYLQYQKQQEKVLSLSGRVNSIEEETRALHLDLVKSKALIFVA
ncbi:unnamed protein product, partial [Ilex paraguariensis]